MGQSTDGILTFGCKLPWGGECCEEIPEGMYTYDDEEEGHDCYEFIEELLKETPYCLVQHCSSECPMYILSFAENCVTAWRGDPKFLTAKNMQKPTEEEIEKFYEFCRENRLPIMGKAQFILCSDWS